MLLLLLFALDTRAEDHVWASRASAADNNWYGVTYGNGLFVAVSSSGTGNRVMTSADGIAWAPAPPPPTMIGAASPTATASSSPSATPATATAS